MEPEDLKQLINNKIQQGGISNYIKAWEWVRQKGWLKRPEHRRMIFMVFDSNENQEEKSNFFAQTGFLQHLVVDGILALNALGWNELPEWLFQLKDIRELNLKANNIRQIPTEIKKLEHLSKLDLSDNQLSTCPGELVFLDRLRWFSLWDNPIESMPEEILQMDHLETLRLGGPNHYRARIHWTKNWTEEEKTTELRTHTKIRPRKFSRSEITAFQGWARKNISY